MNTNPLVKNAWNNINEELSKPIPAFGQKEWRVERRKAIKTILTELQTALMEAKEALRKHIDKWIKDGVAAIRNYADGKDNDFRPEAGSAVTWGIIAKAFEYGLDLSQARAI